MEDQYKYSFTLRTNRKENALFLESADAMTCFLHHLTPASIGKPIEQLYSFSNIRSYYNLLNRQKKDKTPYWAVREYSNGIWKVCITYKKPLLCFNGTRYTSFDEYIDLMQDDLYSQLNMSMLAKSFMFSIIIRKKECSYYIESMHDDLCAFLNVRCGDLVEELLPHLTYLQSLEFFDCCLSTQRMACLLDIFYLNAKAHYICLVVHPLLHEAKRIFIDIHVLTIDTYEMLVSQSNTKNGTPNIRHVPLFHSLTGREQEITELLLRGDSIKVIAQTLMIAEGTVKKTMHNIYRKLCVCSRSELMYLFFSHTQTPIPDTALEQ